MVKRMVLWFIRGLGKIYVSSLERVIKKIKCGRDKDKEGWGQLTKIDSLFARAPPLVHCPVHYPPLPINTHHTTPSLPHHIIDPTHPLLEEVCKYLGESGRNGFSRAEEHLSNKEAEDENKSVLKLHSIHHHNGRDVNCSMKVTGLHSTSLDRQVTESVNIENFQGRILMNRRNEMGGVRVDRMQYRRWGGD